VNAANFPALADARHVGRSLPRVEDAALVAGKGCFADDAGERPGTLHAAILRSPYAHARIRSIDAADALALTGVRAVLLPTDVAAWSTPFAVGVKQPMAHHCLALDKVRYVGEPVAVVVARNRYVAEDALDMIRVEYEPLAAVVDPAEAAAAGAVLLHEAVGSNVVSDREFRYGDPERAFRDAAHEVALTVHYPRNSVTPIECFVVLAEYLAGEDAYDVFSHFQGPFALHPVMARALKVPGARLRLRNARDSGGSFGTKQAVFQYIVLMALAARKARAPVKWVEDRLEHLQAATSATNRLTHIRAAVAGDGRVMALDYDQLDDCGGYLRAPEPATFYRMHGVLTGAYAIEHLHVRNRVVLTNKTPSGLVRGFGGPQVYYALERLMHRIAVELRLDPLEVIRRNLVPAGAFPYRAPAGGLLDSGDYPALVEAGVAEGGLAQLVAKRERVRAAGGVYGIGYTAIVEPSVSNMGYITTALSHEERTRAGPKNGAAASATVSIDALGSVSVTIASTPQGQGHRTVVQQVVADTLGIEPRDVAVNVELDTQKDAWSIASGNYSSRFAAAVAGTVYLAALRVRERLAALAAATLGCEAADVRCASGRFFAANAPERTLPFTRVAGNTHWSPASLPEGSEPALRETVFWSPPTLTEPDEHDRINTSAAYGFVFDYCGVEIDRDTGQVAIDRYVTAHDAGRILHPAMADGQIRGAFSNAVGAALYEEFRYGPDGSFLSGTFADYLVPTACEVPEPHIIHRETPSPFTPLGAKGLGEGNSMSTPVCIANAVADALGRDDVALPLTPVRVRAMLADYDGRIETPPRAGVLAATPGAGSAPPAAGAARAGRGMRASGSVRIDAPPERVFTTLTDPASLARVVPGVHMLEPVGPNRFRADVTLGVGPVKARYRAEIALEDLDPPRALTLSGKGVSSVGSAEGSGRVRLAAENGGTRLDYEYDVAISGKVAAVGARMLEGAARIVLDQVFARLGAIATGGAPDTRASFWRRVLRRLRGRR
jgi:2-furoyl-CoA dehydrogenase large subunit